MANLTPAMTTAIVKLSRYEAGLIEWPRKQIHTLTFAALVRAGLTIEEVNEYPALTATGRAMAASLTQ